MPLDLENDYTPLPEAAQLMGLPYSTAHQYCKEGALAGAILFRGTRWMVSKRTIQLWNDGKINIKGTFRKGNRDDNS